MALPIAAIVCIVLACWVLVVLIAFAVYQLLKSRGTCSCDCAPCGKEERGGCCECCISLSDSCNCCNPSVNGCLDKICPGKKKVSCVDLILCQCFAGEGEQSCCLKKVCDNCHCDDCQCCSSRASASPTCNVPCLTDTTASLKCLSCACPRWICSCYTSQCSCLDCLSKHSCCYGDGVKCCEHYACCCCECNLKEDHPSNFRVQGAASSDDVDSNLVAHLTDSLARKGVSMKLISSDGIELQAVESANELKESIRKSYLLRGRPFPPTNHNESTIERTLPVSSHVSMEHNDHYSKTMDGRKSLQALPVVGRSQEDLKHDYRNHSSMRDVMREDRLPPQHSRHHSTGVPRQATHGGTGKDTNTPRRKKRPKKVEGHLATCTTEVVPLNKDTRKPRRQDNNSTHT